MATNDLFSPVRWFTALDPYYFTVDNRPIGDINTNLALTAQSTDAATASAKNAAIAAGMIARGYAGENFMVGSLAYPGGVYTLTLDRAFLLHSLAVSGLDARLVPHVGLIIEPEEVVGGYLFNPAPAVGEFRPYLVQARKIDASTDTPQYDVSNPYSADAFIVGDIEMSVKVGVDGFAVTIPSPDVGWIPIFEVVVPEGATELLEEYVSYANFHEEGASFGGGSGGTYDLQTATRTATPGQTQFLGITELDCNYAFVYVQGTFQGQNTYVIDSSDSITFSEPLDGGERIDFVATAGGTFTQGNFQVHTEEVVGPVLKSVFTSIPVNTEFASVYISGVFQPPDTYVVNSVDQITLNTPLDVVSGDTIRVSFAERNAGVVETGVVVPAGGVLGDALVKLSGTDYDYSWQAVGGGGSGVPIGGDTGQVLAKLSPVDGDVDWIDVADSASTSYTVETQVVPPGPDQSVFSISSEAASTMTFVQGSFQGTAATATGLSEVTLDTAVPSGTILEFVQTGAGSPDTVTINKEMDVSALLASQRCLITPSGVIHGATALDTDKHLMSASTLSAEIYRSSDGGRSWASENPTNLPVGIFGLGYGNSIVVSVGEAGTTSYSNDLGNTWSVGGVVSGVSSELAAVAYDAASRWVTVGNGGRVAYSDNDGSTWTAQTLNLGATDFKDVLWTGSIWVIVGTGGGTSGNIFTSADGVIWVPQTSPVIDGIAKVTFGNNRYVAVTNTTPASILQSIDSVTWSVASSVLEKGTGAQFVDNVFYVFTEDNQVVVSTDTGATWTPYLIGNGEFTDYYSTMLVAGPNIVLLGTYTAGRCYSKIRR